MGSPLDRSRDRFTQSMARISEFWGFPRAMGAIYAAIYLSPEPISLDALVELVGVTKGAVSTHVRALARLGMVHRHVELGDRRDYYVAETDFWKIARGVLREREKPEFDLALRAVGECVEEANSKGAVRADPERARFYVERMDEMRRFFDRLDDLVRLALTLADLRSGSIVTALRKRPTTKRR